MCTVVHIWDDVRKKIILQFNFELPVKSVRLYRDGTTGCRLAATFQEQICVYRLSKEPQLLKTVQTASNRLGREKKKQPIHTRDSYISNFQIWSRRVTSRRVMSQRQATNQGRVLMFCYVASLV